MGTYYWSLVRGASACVVHSALSIPLSDLIMEGMTAALRFFYVGKQKMFPVLRKVEMFFISPSHRPSDYTKIIVAGQT